MPELMEVLKRYRTDPAKESEGVWETLTLAPGVTFEVRIASRHTPAYQNRVMDTASAKGLAETDEEATRRLAEIAAGTLLTDWRGLTHDGDEIPFSEATAVEMLTELRAFREEVYRLASRQDRFRDDNLEEVAKRLGNFWSGESGTAPSSAKKPSKKGSKKDTPPKDGTSGST